MCIARHGLEVSTLDVVADEAGVKRTLIRHYLGNRNKVLRALIECIVERERAKVSAPDTWVGVTRKEIISAVLGELFMGIAIDDFLAGKYIGLLALAGLGLMSLLVGAGRRFYDTRIYSTISPEMVEREKARSGSSVRLSSSPFYKPMSFSHALPPPCL